MNGDGASGMGNSHSADPNGGFAFFWLKEDLPNLMNDGSDKIMRWTNGDGGLGLGTHLLRIGLFVIVGAEKICMP